MIESLNRAVELSHALVAETLGPGEIAVDATCGKGRDACFLCGLVGRDGKVYAVDIQERAVRETERLVKERGYSERCEVILGDHANIDAIVPKEDRGRVKAIMYNLGYLPGADKATMTTEETTLASVEKALGLLAPGGVITVCLYPHERGKREADALKEFASSLTSPYNAHLIERLNRRDAPSVLVFTKDEVER